MGKKVYLIICLIHLLLNVVNFGQSSIQDDEDRVTSEGMWQSLSLTGERTPTISTGHGNSRIDVNGILTAIGLQQGANMLGLVIFPILLPLMMILAAALFVISMFSAATSTIVSGRRFDVNGEDYDLAPGLMNFTNTILASEDCVERFACEILQRISDNSTSKAVLRLLDAVNVFPDSMDKVRSTGSNPLRCTDIKCNFRKFIFKVFDYAKT